MNLRELHECKKSENKIVAIEVNGTGVTFCSYCHKPVPYNNLFNKEVEEHLKEKCLTRDKITSNNKKLSNSKD